MTRSRTSLALPTEFMERMAESLPPIAPAPDRAAAIKAELLDRVHASRSEFVTVRKAEGDWIQVGPLAHVKVLHDDGQVRSLLLRLAPGARITAHGHTIDEACVVLEGSAQLGELEVHAGDFHLAPAGSVHGEIVTRTGALLYLHTDSRANIRFK